MSRSTIKLGKDQKIGLYGEADVWGSDGAETILLNKGATKVEIKGGVEKVDLSMASDDYQFSAYGGTLYIMQGGEVVSSVALDDTGATVAFVDGAVQVSKAEDGTVSIGDQVLVSGADGVALDEKTANLDTEVTSESGQADPTEYTLADAVAKLVAGEELDPVYELTQITVDNAQSFHAGTISMDEYQYVDAAVSGAKNADDVTEVTYDIEDTTSNIVNGIYSVVSGASKKYVVDNIVDYTQNSAKLPTGITFSGVKLTGSDEGEIIILQDSAPELFADAEPYLINDVAVTHIAGGGGYDFIQMRDKVSYGKSVVIFAGEISESKAGLYAESQDIAGSQSSASIEAWFTGYADNKAAKKALDLAKNGNIMDWFGDQSVTLVCSNVKDTILMQTPESSLSAAEKSEITIHQFNAQQDKLLYLIDGGKNDGMSTADLTVSAINKATSVTELGGTVAITFNASKAFGIENASYLDNNLTINLVGVQNYDANTAIADLFGVTAEA